ncbi:hypothetical protein KUL113_34960 [Tenacibaculum sp. KUL113]|uniref:nuclease-related domain-containing DEAD/DEAH box helicase n=1 Tax=Alteromonas sp. RW2A1 TaxID=1917158 RepID=UPI0009036FA8|nr:NERD domain-containing protein [Alteromonas sp. RW2A1]APE06282.1 hypothetical protein BM528_11305 [Alteromonas sp. RW2A1]GFD74076.1 hypothetical protein KUL113_34960 [Tenacibaculum sp. KUL113]
MSNMIPRVIDIDNPSDGEKHLFERLRQDPDTKGWTVLHSLNIAHHKTQVLGEIDFLVIIPEVCIFAIEVKAHRYIKFDQGLWYFGRSSRSSLKGPFEQANDAVFSLAEYLKSKNISLSSIPIFPLVIFTHTELIAPSIEWHSREFCGVREYRKIPISKLLLNRATSYRKKLANTSTVRWFKPTDTRPTQIDVETLIKVLRPSLEMSTSFGFFRDETKKDLFEYTKEQFVALDAMEDNSRVVFNGAAGVGKTVLALESSNRVTVRGERVLFVCKNKNLAISLRRFHSNIDILTITELLELHANSEFVKKSDRNRNDYWTTDLPNNAFEEILNKENVPYNYLVIDEAQDILSVQNWLDCLELLLDKGLSNGRWSLFGDFELQNIYSMYQKNTLLSDFRLRCNDFSTYRLAINCRNIQSVSELSFSLASIKIPYRKFLRKSNPLFDSKYYFYSSDEDQVNKILSVIKLLNAQGFKASELVLLSKVSESKSISKKFESELKVVPFCFRDNAVQYTSIHSFKGLESPVIILTDFSEIESEQSKKLLYVGASRATEIVIYMFKDEVKKHLLKGIKN